MFGQISSPKNEQEANKKGPLIYFAIDERPLKFGSYNF